MILALARVQSQPGASWQNLRSILEWRDEQEPSSRPMVPRASQTDCRACCSVGRDRDWFGNKRRDVWQMSKLTAQVQTVSDQEIVRRIERSVANRNVDKAC